MLRPGDPIREVEIAEALGISRGPVREALQQLQQQGLITGEPQKAKFIRHMSKKEIEDSYELGGVLESACIIQSLSEFTPNDLLKVKEILDQMRSQSTIAAGLAAMSSLDDAFHDALLARCENKLMVKVARDSCAHISKFLYYRELDGLFSPQEFYQRHKDVYEAVISRNSAQIQAVLLDHYQESGRRLGIICDGSQTHPISSQLAGRDA